ncbi:hypothetical protein FB451DRAFT_1549945 [Mycena latifolia]|nr:hypothetical protein FB451DRAFT_1549945 [Mycena latifolia]
MQFPAALLAVSALVASALSQSSTSLSPAQITHVITVSNNLTASNGTNVFSPQVVNASLGETVLFNFTQGNHSATQSTFAVPCVPAHDTNSTINGFDTDLRPAGNGTSITTFVIVMNPDIVNTTLWFYDKSTCGIGGVGVINAGNVSATLQPIDAFVRNAIRLNGTGTATSASHSATGSSSSGTDSGSGSGSSPSSGSSDTGAAPRAFPLAPVLAVLPLLLLGAALVL